MVRYIGLDVHQRFIEVGILDALAEYQLSALCHEHGSLANVPTHAAIVIEPLCNTVRRRPHDTRHFPIEIGHDGLFSVPMDQFFDIPPQSIDAIDNPAKVTVGFELLFQRSRPTHFQLGNQKAFGQIISPALQLS